MSNQNIPNMPAVPQKVLSPAEKARIVAEAQRKKAQREAKTDRGLQERFDRRVRGRFDKIVYANYPTQIPGITSISIGPKGTESLEVIVWWDAGKERQTFTIDENGGLYGQIPKELGYIDKDKLKDEILRIIENFKLGQNWVPLDIDVFPPGKGPATIQHGGGQGYIPPVIDPDRVIFLDSQKDNIRAFTAGGRGFSGYHGLLYSKFVFLENFETQNAVYIIDFEHEIEHGEIKNNVKVYDIPADPEGFSAWIKKQPWASVLKMSREEARAAGAIRKIHVPDRWRATFQDEINKRA